MELLILCRAILTSLDGLLIDMSLFKVFLLLLKKIESKVILVVLFGFGFVLL